jgi:hypothetical protein
MICCSICNAALCNDESQREFYTPLPVCSGCEKLIADGKTGVRPGRSRGSSGAFYESSDMKSDLLPPLPLLP